MNRIPFLILTVCTLAMTAFGAGADPVPEIDGSTAVAAVALVSGGLVVLRSRRKK